MRNLNYLKKLIAETIEEDVRKSSRKKSRLSESRRRRAHQRKLREGLQKALDVLEEKADPAKFPEDKFPFKLSDAGKVGQARATELTTSGDDDGNETDDVIPAVAGSKSCKELKPSQSSMNAEKAMCFALGAITKYPKMFPDGPGGDLGAIITSDNHIMDGHHRWIASGMVDPNAQVGGFIVEFPARQMIAALNMVTVALTGKTTGKEASGGFERFNEEGFLAVLKDFMSQGHAYFMKKGKKIIFETLESAEAVQAACDQYTGLTGEESIKATAKKMGDNVKELTLSTPEGFPERPDMPMISAKAGHLAKAVELLNNGEIDLNPPYAGSGEMPDQAAEESQTTNLENLDDADKKMEESITRRWGKLAGLIKG